MISLWIIGSLLGFAVLISIVWNSWKYGITPTPTGYKVQQSILKLCPSQVSGQIVELGSGWGTLALALAKHYPDHPVIGYEISPIPYFFSLFLKKIINQNTLQLKRKDFFLVPLHDAGLVICYLYPGAMELLKVKFEKELKPNSIVISHTFAIHGWTPIEVYKVSDLYQTPIYIYKII